MQDPTDFSFKLIRFLFTAKIGIFHGDLQVQFPIVLEIYQIVTSHFKILVKNVLNLKKNPVVKIGLKW